MSRSKNQHIGWNKPDGKRAASRKARRKKHVFAKGGAFKRVGYRWDIRDEDPMFSTYANGDKVTDKRDRKGNRTARAMKSAKFWEEVI